MRLIHAFLWLIARIVPAESRRRWLEEWRAELAHGRWTMVFGAPRDAWALRSQSAARPNAQGFFLGPVFLLCSPLWPPLWHAFPQDVRYALRGLMKSPGFTFAAIASLSIGIAANTTALSVLNALVCRPYSSGSMARLKRWRPVSARWCGRSTTGCPSRRSTPRRSSR